MKTLEKKRSQLALNVEGTNEMNKYTLQVIKEVLPKLEALKGVKILLSNEKASKKFNIPTNSYKGKLDNAWIDCHYWFDISKYSIWLKVKVCINGGSHEDRTAYCNYFEYATFLGKLENDCLVSVEDISKYADNKELNTVLNEADCIKQVEEYKAIQERVDELYRAIPEYIRRANYLSH